MAQSDIEHGREGPLPELTRRTELAGATGMAEGVTAIAAVVLATLGLAGLLTLFMLAVSCIVLGAALLFEGGTVAARVSRFLALRVGAETEKLEFEGGIAAEALVGLAGVVLGILALVGIAPLTLCSVAAIAYGGGLLFGSGASAKLNASRLPLVPTPLERATREAVFISAGGELMVGLAAIVLGILALLDIVPVTLTLVAFLAVGGALVLSGTAVGSKMFGLLRRT
jgi:hypothetical protein